MCWTHNLPKLLRHRDSSRQVLEWGAVPSINEETSEVQELENTYKGELLLRYKSRFAGHAGVFWKIAWATRKQDDAGDLEENLEKRNTVSEKRSLRCWISRHKSEKVGVLENIWSQISKENDIMRLLWASSQMEELDEAFLMYHKTGLSQESMAAGVSDFVRHKFRPIRK